MIRRFSITASPRIAFFLLLLSASWLFSKDSPTGASENSDSQKTEVVATDNTKEEAVGMDFLERIKSLEKLDYFTLSVNLLLFLLLHLFLPINTYH